jgi:hypothetical protein
MGRSDIKNHHLLRWNCIWGYLGGMRINKKVSGSGKPDTFLINGKRSRGILKAL